VRVVLDTTVLVSGVLTPGGVCHRILEMVRDDVFIPCVDGRILEEYEAVFLYPKLSPVQGPSREILSFLRTVAVRVGAIPLSATLPDASDLPFLEVASAASAILVTGNLRHFPKGVRGGVVVETPAGLLELLRSKPRPG
jgi:putative PIN family toxin of toxin-antitoxin system